MRPCKPNILIYKMSSHPYIYNSNAKMLHIKDYTKIIYLCNPLIGPRSGCGVIGSRARLRIWCRKAWGFESLHPHSKCLNFHYNM